MNTKIYFSLAIDQFIDEKLYGRLYHPAVDGVVMFESLMDLAKKMETILDHIRKPMRTTEVRCFQKNFHMTGEEFIWKESDRGLALVEEPETEEICGKLATVQVSVNFRYHATWQGQLVWKEKQENHVFRSFLELTCILGQILEGSGMWAPETLTPGMCKIAVDEYQNSCVKGTLLRIHQESRIPFYSCIGLIREIRRLSGNETHVAIPELISNRAFRTYKKTGERATFTVRVLFTNYGTWQGTICWCEEKTRMNFRSFLEMMILMDSALDVERTEMIYETVAQ